MNMETIGERLKRLREGKSISQGELAKRAGLKSQGAIGNIERDMRGYGASVVNIARELGTTPEYLQMGGRAAQEPLMNTDPNPAPAPHEAPSDSPGSLPDLVITEFDTGGGMDTTGRLLLDDQPGIIKSWRVSHEWLRLNVPIHSGVRNLCIVTGFGPSMRPMFNPGDPLLVDTGVKTVNHEGVYFFRVGDEGYIKLIQRVPEFDGPGFCLRIISKNPDFPPYDISPKSPHFEVLGKVLTVWRSEQY